MQVSELCITVRTVEGAAWTLHVPGVHFQFPPFPRASNAIHENSQHFRIWKSYTGFKNWEILRKSRDYEFCRDLVFERAGCELSPS